jgi:hypothetical protein
MRRERLSSVARRIEEGELLAKVVLAAAQSVNEGKKKKKNAPILLTFPKTPEIFICYFRLI